MIEKKAIIDILESFVKYYSDIIDSIKDNKIIEQCLKKIDEFSKNIDVLSDIVSYNFVEISNSKRKTLDELLENIRLASTELLHSLLEHSIRNNAFIKDYISDVKKYCVDKQKVVEPYKRKLDTLKGLIEYVSSLDDMQFFEKIDEIYSVIEPDNTDIACRLSILINSYNNSVVDNLTNDKNKPVEKPDGKQEENKITLDELKNLFKEYGYDISKVPNMDNEMIETFLKRGVIEDIRACFEFYKNNKVNLKEKDNKQFLTILYRTNGEIIDNVVSICKNYKINIINLMKCTPTVFFKYSDKDNKRVPSVVNGVPYDCSTFKNFVNNVELLAEEGYDIAIIAQNNPSALSISSNRVKVMRDDLKTIFNMSDENKGKKLADIFSRVTWIRADNIFTKIAQYAELGELDYLTANASRFSDEFVFVPYRIYMTKKLGVGKGFYHQREKLKGFLTYKFNNTTSDRAKKESILEKVGSRAADVEKIMSIDNDDVFITNGNHPIFGQTVEKLYDEIINDYTGSLDNANLDDDISYIINNYSDSNDDKLININGVKIYKLKLLRYFSALYSYITTANKKDIILYCLTKNSILDDKDFEIVKDFVDNMGRGRK